MSVLDQLDMKVQEHAETQGFKYKGMPFEGEKYEIDKDNLPIKSKKIGIKQLNLTKSKDMLEYIRICQLHADGMGCISFEEKKYDESIKSWRVLIRWFEHIYKENKKEEQ